MLTKYENNIELLTQTVEVMIAISPTEFRIKGHERVIQRPCHYNHVIYYDQRYYN